ASASATVTSGSAEDRPTTSASTLTRDRLVQLWGDGLLASLPGRARARFRVGRFVAVDGTTAVFALPNETHRSYCEDVRLDVEAKLGDVLGTPVSLRLVIDEEADDDAPPVVPRAPRRGRTERAPETSAGPETSEPDLLDPVVLAAETEPAGAGPSPEERLKRAFPGAQEV
ncbi:MAG TPA: hypothetical protein VMF60_10350, partial [Acidimicrobiales bacterium]|nr:hypothetical protein [Acidimicrobiales bacterium]